MFWGCIVLPSGLGLCAFAMLFTSASETEDGIGIGIFLAVLGGAMILTAGTRMQQAREKRKSQRQQTEMVNELRELRKAQQPAAPIASANPGQLELTNRALGQALKMLKESGKTDDELKPLIKVYRQNRQ